jgi:hypothetical protein
VRVSRFGVANLVAILLLAGCSAVDQYGARIHDVNVNSQDALNGETLLNVLRAEKHETPNFVAVSSVTGGQSETLTTGLPTVTFGPEQTIAQHQYAVSNGVSSVANSSFVSNPIQSTGFQDGMMSPVTLRQLAQLLASHPHDLVFYTVIDTLVVADASGKTVTLYNDPDDNLPPDGDGEKPGSCPAPGGPDGGVDYAWSRADIFDHPDVCSYAKFKHMMVLLMTYGLSAEIISPADQAAVTQSLPRTNSATGKSAVQSDSKGSPAASGSAGIFCFDNSYRDMGYSHRNTDLDCDVSPKLRNHTKEFTFGNQDYGYVTLKYVKMRSPLSIYSLIGKLRHTSDQPYWVSRTTRRIPGKFVEIDEGKLTDCYTSVDFAGHHYCVPRGAEKTAVVFDILQQLRNLNIQPSDLNSAFNVHVTN